MRVQKLLAENLADDSGVTLIELLVASLILGLAVVAIVGAFMTGVLGSGLHRQQASVHAVVVDAVEQLEAAEWKSDCSYTVSLPSQFGTPGERYETPQYSCATDGNLQTFSVTATSVADGQSETLTFTKYNKGS